MVWDTNVTAFDWTFTTLQNFGCGLLSGWLSGWVVTKYYRKKDETLKAEERAINDSREASELLYGLHARLYFIFECFDQLGEERIKEIIAEDLHPIPQKLKQYQLGPRATEAKVQAFKALNNARDLIRNGELNNVNKAITKHELLKACFDLISSYKIPFK